MSGVLERMVQRTRGTLPAAEPRIAVSTLPRQAPSGADNAEWLGEVNVQVVSGPRAGDGRSASASNDSVASARNRAASIDPHKASQPAQVPDRVAGSESPVSFPRQKEPLNHQEASQAAHGVEREAAVSTTAVPDKSSLEPARPGVAESPSRESMRITQNAPQGEEESSRPSAGERMSAVDNDEPTEPRSAVDDRLQIVHEHREISISIGTVSMQSTPQPAPRVAPAFRPRVSLDAFLERRQGSR